MATTTNENLISNSSYTEKDFQVIYPALLDLVKKLTLRWDPSASNESDPGVLLLKLNALVADKCNYNIDKNVLECFPLSVTQETNARQLFEQLGYYMHWYKGATTTVVLKYIKSQTSPTDYTGEDNTSTSDDTIIYTIPRFTMVCDADSKVVYTLVEEKTLKSDGTLQTFDAVQGIAVKFEINGETLVTTSDLDSNNRLYFTDTKIAENGIFIHNKGVENYSSWVKKDNLLVEQVSSSNCFYKFGISQDMNTCYIEFPENAEELFQDGIEITYIKTDGEGGDIAAYALENFYQDVTVKNPASTSAENEEITLTTETVSIKNYFVGGGGKNPETINDAYLGYKKTVGTFKTLVTLRDYMNAVAKSSFVSNALVCDRTTDPQSTYNIMTQNGSVNQAINEVEVSTDYDIQGYLYPQNENGDFYEDEEHKHMIDPNVDKNYLDITPDENRQPINKSYRLIYKNDEVTGASMHKYIEANAVEKPALKAFDIKMYLLSAVALINSATTFNKTFNLERDSSVQDIVNAELEEYKIVQHDVASILKDKLCFIKNKYPINCTVIPQYAVTEAQSLEITRNIRQALYDNLNSAKLTFGDEVSYETIYNIILDSDTRIKAIALDRLTYTSYAVYIDSEDNQVKEVDLSNYTSYYQDTYTLSNEISGTTLGTLSVSATILNDEGQSLGKSQNIELVDDAETFRYGLIKFTDKNECYSDNALLYRRGSWLTLGSVTGSNISIYKNTSATTPALTISKEVVSIVKSSGNYYEISRYGLYEGETSKKWKTFYIKKSDVTETYSSKKIKYAENIVRVAPGLYNWMLTNSEDITHDVSDIEVDNDKASEFRIDIYAKSVLAGTTQFFVKDTDFDYGINQKYQLLERSIGRLDATVDVEFKPTVGDDLEPWTYEMRENETIQLLAPNLLESKNFGTNIRFEYYIPKAEGKITDSIPANSAYKLNANEYIAFYWAESTGTATGYEFAIFGAGTIIQPTFTMAKDVPSKYNQLICTNPDYNLIGKMYPVTVNNQTYQYYSGNSYSEVNADNLTAAIKKLVNAENVLTSNREISIMVMNSIVLSKTSDYCYWVLNEKENDRYYLFKVTDGPTRILKAGEYFIYTTTNGADMHILGAGTKIYKPGSLSSDLFVDAMDYSTIIEGGILTLTNYWMPLNGIELDITEMQYHLFGDGVMVNIQPTDGDFIDSIEATGDGLTKTFDLRWDVKEVLNAKVGGGAAVEQSKAVNYTTETAYKKWDTIKYENKYYRVSNSISADDNTDWETFNQKAQPKVAETFYTVENNKTITFSPTPQKDYVVHVDMSTNTIKLTSDVDKDLNGCTIKYKENINDSWTIVPDVVIADSELQTKNNWSGRTNLRINASNSTAQYIQAGQKVYYYFYDKEAKTISSTYDGVIDPYEQNWGGEAYLFTSRLINNVGGLNISTLQKDENDVDQPIDIYAYIHGDMSKDIKILDNGSTMVIFQEDTSEGAPAWTQTQEKYITFRLPAGNYIMPVYHDTDDELIDEVFMYLDRGTVEPLNPTNTYSSGDIISAKVVTVNALPSKGDTNTIYLVAETVTPTPPTPVKLAVDTVQELAALDTSTYSINDIFQVNSDIRFKYFTTYYKLIDKEKTGMNRFEFMQSQEPVLQGYKQWMFINNIWKSSSVLLSEEEMNTFQGTNYYEYISSTPSSPATTLVFVTNKTVWQMTAGEMLYPMGLSDADKKPKNANMYKAGNYYLRVKDLPDGDAGTFFVKVLVKIHYIKNYAPGEVPVVTVVVPPIFKYSDSSALAEDEELNAKLFTKINQRIRELDIHNLFDYTYVVDEDYEIKDPLASDSYLNVNHVMNNCTIPQLDTGNATLYVTNKIKG